MLLDDKTPIKVNVPIECIGIENCVGVNLGGNLRRVIRSLKVRCLIKDMPEKLQVDVTDLGLGQKVRLRDLPISANIRPIGRMDEVAIVVAKKR